MRIAPPRPVVWTALALLWLGGVAAPRWAGAESAAPATTVSPAVAPEQAARAIATVESLHVGLLEVMKQADTLGFAGRERLLAEVVPGHFDVVYMARKALGRYWARSEEAARARYLETFERFMIANYAGRFDGWSGQRFQVEEVSPADRGTLLVRSLLVDPGGDDVELTYRLRPLPEGDWKAIDVFLDGTVSELALRYSEFVSILKREDLDALISALDERILALAAGDGAG